MQPFKEYFSDVETAVREPQPEVDRNTNRLRSQELINLRNQIRRHREAASRKESTPLSPEEVESLKHRVASLAGELEGSRLPMDAERAAADAYNDLTAMSESTEDQSLRESILESRELIKGLISEEAIEEGILNKQDA
jgi:hypothetical protein